MGRKNVIVSYLESSRMSPMSININSISLSSSLSFLLFSLLFSSIAHSDNFPYPPNFLVSSWMDRIKTIISEKDYTSICIALNIHSNGWRWVVRLKMIDCLFCFIWHLLPFQIKFIFGVNIAKNSILFNIFLHTKF